MTKYVCPNCKKDFKQKINYINHTEKKKFPCKPKENIIHFKSITEDKKDLIKNIIISPPKTLQNSSDLPISPPKTLQNSSDLPISPPKTLQNSSDLLISPPNFLRFVNFT